MKVYRKIIEIDETLCDGCGQCVAACDEGAIAIINNKAKVIKDEFCDGLGACLGDCPQNALRIIQREADEFNPEAVEKHLAAKEKQPIKKMQCPAAKILIKQPSEKPVSGKSQSNLCNWPVKIRLIPPTASFLKSADLLIVADCAPVTMPDFNEQYLKNKVIMMGCPKFDDVDVYIAKFSEIFKISSIKSITILIIDVPCCSGLPRIIDKAMKIANQEIPTDVVVCSR